LLGVVLHTTWKFLVLKGISVTGEMIDTTKVKGEAKRIP
jgi:hypothetical protein